jgi:hypothetical protein
MLAENYKEYKGKAGTCIDHSLFKEKLKRIA